MQLSCHSVAVVRILVWTNIENIHKETAQKHSTDNTKNSKYKYTFCQKTHTLRNPQIHTPTHYKTHTYTHPHITKPTHTHTH
jgi:hypothetical protein